MTEHDDNQEPGLSLRQAREAAGLSTKEVADGVNLLVSYVEALEANDYTHMNADIFVRGYVKSYARFLGVDPEPLLAAAEKRLNRDRDEEPAGSVDNVAGAVARRGLSPAQKVGAALIAAALLWLLANLLMASDSDAHSAALLSCERPLPAGQARGVCEVEFT